jgi:hypothetical protein
MLLEGAPLIGCDPGEDFGVFSLGNMKQVEVVEFNLDYAAVLAPEY